jgi:hypothetical protein
MFLWKLLNTDQWQNKPETTVFIWIDPVVMSSKMWSAMGYRWYYSDLLFTLTFDLENENCPACLYFSNLAFKHEWMVKIVLLCTYLFIKKIIFMFCFRVFDVVFFLGLALSDTDTEIWKLQDQNCFHGLALSQNNTKSGNYFLNFYGLFFFRV